MSVIGPFLALAAMTLGAAATPPAGTSTRNSVAVAGSDVAAQVVGPGGTSMTSPNGLSLDGTAGEVNSQTMTGANGLSLASGFWPVVIQLTGDKIFASGFETAAP